jgi:hypothetical protein
MAEAGVLGSYHLLLAHQVLDQPAIHEAFYKGQLPRMRKYPDSENRSLRKTPYIIMDNSLIELGYPLPVEDVVIAAETVNASVIVLPDVLGDRIKTLEQTTKAVITLDELRPRSPYARRVKMLGVAQGQTLNEVFSCARDMIQLLGVDIVSIPRHVTAKVGSRIKLAQMVRQYGKPVHLLGFSENLLDDFTALGIPGVMGIDSAVPIWYGLQGFELPTTPPVQADYGKRPEDYESQTEINSKVIQNIRRVERWVNIAKTAPTGR